MKNIPFVDLKSVTSPDETGNEKDSLIALAKHVRKITGEIGFMQLINHGIPDQIIQDLFEQTKLFFSSPEEVKLKYEKPENPDMENYHGYNKLGRENVNFAGKAALEFRENFDWVEGRGTYPGEELPKFVPTIEKFHSHCVQLAKTIYKLWAIGLDQDEDIFIKKNQHWVDPSKVIGLTNVRLAHYPKISDGMEFPPGSVRINEHCDINTLTFLFQDDVGGLEVKATDGEWIHIDPVPGSIICNTGDLLEYWTSGLYPATPHRILLPNMNNPKRRDARYSLAYFSGPDVTEMITPLQILMTPEEECRLAKSGKARPTETISALYSCMKKLKLAYSNTYEQE